MPCWMSLTIACCYHVKCCSLICQKSFSLNYSYFTYFSVIYRAILVDFTIFITIKVRYHISNTIYCHHYVSIILSVFLCRLAGCWRAKKKVICYFLNSPRRMVISLNHVSRVKVGSDQMVYAYFELLLILGTSLRIFWAKYYNPYSL